MSLLADLLGAAAGWIGARGLPIATIAGVVLVLAYGRKGMRVGGLVAGWVRTVFIVVLAIAALTAAGVLIIKVDPIVAGIRWVLESLVGLIATTWLQAAGPPSWLPDLLGDVLDFAGAPLDGVLDAIGRGPW